MATNIDQERGNDEVFDFLCSVCKGKKKNVEADKFCTQCLDYFCDNCVIIHEQVSGLKQHKILDKVKVPSDPRATFPAVPTETCTLHGHKPVDMYCEQHDRVGCSTCMVVDHSNCIGKFYVPDYITHKQVGSAKDVSGSLDAIGSRVRELQKVLKSEKKRLTDSKTILLEHIKHFREEINQRLDELEKNTRKATDETLQPIADYIYSKMKQLESLKAEIKCAQESLKLITGNQAQLFVTLKQANEVVFRATEIVQKKSKKMSLPEVCFSADQKLQSLFKQIQSLGSIHSTDPTHSLDTSQNIWRQQDMSMAEHQQQQQQQRHNHQQSEPTRTDKEQGTTTGKKRNENRNRRMPSLLRIKGKTKCSVEVPSDRGKCQINSVCVLENNTVVLLDSNNAKLKRLDRSTYTVKDCCDIQGYPWQVCVVSRQEVAVSCGENKLIQFVSVGSKMHTTRQLHTDFSCNGLAYVDGKFYVSDENTSVYVYSDTGKRLQRFNQDLCGKSLFSEICCLSVSDDSSRIYVADWDKGLIILDSNGKPVGEHSEQQLDGAHSVCLFKDNTVLVSGWSSKNVLQFTANGKLIGELLKSESHCRVVCWDEWNSKLIVGYESSDYFDVFDI